MSGIIKLVHRSDDPDGPFKTIAEVAEYFERDKDTIRRWSKALSAEGEPIPSHKMMLGEGDSGAFVWLYTEHDMERFVEHSQNIKPGRPKQDQ